MAQISTHLKESVLLGRSRPDFGSRRAVCENCGAHAAVMTRGASVTGACAVCGGTRLQVMDRHVPPPRRQPR